MNVGGASAGISFVISTFWSSKDSFGCSFETGGYEMLKGERFQFYSVLAGEFNGCVFVILVGVGLLKFADDESCDGAGDTPALDGSCIDAAMPIPII